VPLDDRRNRPREKGFSDARGPHGAGPFGGSGLPAAGAGARAVAVAFLAVLAVACSGPARRASAERAPEAGAVEPGSVDPARLHAVLINGGGDRRGNYYSHYVHLRAMLGVLDRAGVPPENVTVFASDGADPATDLAVRELRPEGDGWLLEGTKLAATVGEPIEYVDTQLDGRSLEKATRGDLERWFREDGKKLGPGDTLLFYVTDHGTRGKDGPRSNRISLWGTDESLSVDDLGRLLGELDPGVRVVALMSQCYSGGFGMLAAEADGAAGPGGYCGFFSSTADRPAYGCYAENRGADDVGHSVRFIEALAAGDRFPESHRHALASDHTPDVPLRTTDVFLQERLESGAKAKGVDVADYADALLVEAWRDKGSYETEIRLVDRVGQSYGFASLRSLEEVDGQLAQLSQVSVAIDEHAGAWNESRGDLARANLGRFLAAEPGWNERISAEHTRELTPDAARELGDDLLASLGPFTHADRETDVRLRSLRGRSETASVVAYRMQVREAALLRMEALLLRIAGQVHLRTRATPAERATYARLESCEDLALPLRERAPAVAPGPFPSYAADVELAETVLPGWMGIQFRPAPPDQRTRLGLAGGAVNVQRVYPGSPAERAGILPGDVIVGPRGRPFVEPRQIREWTMLAAIDEPQTLEVVHDGARVFRELVPGAHPGRFPALPAPPRVGTSAPGLEIERYRGEVPKTLADGRPHLLFFWATWCGPCKASLPELMEFARDRGVDVVAVTDEDKAQLDGFFASFREPFPANVALDVDRDAFLGYAVSGTPTFVLVDEAGRIAHYGTGYDQARGLGLPGWKRPTG
jgi:thiol-disulfide isomerase/thioredoxin